MDGVCGIWTTNAAGKGTAWTELVVVSLQLCFAACVRLTHIPHYPPVNPDTRYKAYQASTSRLIPWVPGKPKWR